jgi:hypothetical protein
MLHARWFVLGLAVVAGCGKKDAPQPAAQPSSTAPPAASSAAPAKAESPLHLIAKLPAAGASLRGVGPYVFVNYNKLFFRGAPDGLHQAPDLTNGLRPYFSWTSFEALGEWRNETGFALLQARGTAGGYTQEGSNPAGAGAPERPVFKMTKGSWGYSSLTNEKDTLINIGPWSDDRSLGAAIIDPGDDWRMFLAGGKPAVPPYPSAPKAEKPDADANTPPSEPSTPTTAGGCKTKLLPFASRAAFAPLASGHIFALGVDCTSAARTLAVERWEPGNRKSTIDALPDPGEKPSAASYSLLAVSGTQVFVYRSGDKSKPYLVKFDGKEWKGDAAPSESAPIKRLVAADDGTLYALVDGKIHQRKAGAAWSQVELPQAEGATPKIEDIAVSGAQNLWALSSPPALLFGPAKPKGVMTLPGPGEVASALEPKGGVDGYFLATPACESFYVPLQTGVTEAGKYPEPEKALKGQSGLDGAEFVIDNRGPAGLVLGAKVPSAAVGARVVELMKAANPKAPSVLSCYVPKVKKTVTFE